MWNELKAFKPPTTPANTEDLCAADIGPENSLISLASSNGPENLISRSLAQRVGTDLLLSPPQPWHFPSNPLPSKKKPSSSPNKSQKWAISPNHIDVVPKQGSLPILLSVSDLLAEKLHAIITKAAKDGKPVLTMGAIDLVQMTQMARFQEVVSVSGAFAIHFEDQLHGGKKCGHFSGKVLVPTSTHTSRLVSARFQLDLPKSTMLIIARTNAESGKLISSAVDVADHEFVKVTTVPGKPLAEVTGAEGKEVDRIGGEWMGEHRLVTFGEAEAAIKVSTIKDKEVPRTREGYYHVTSGLGRATTFAPYADLVWLETKTPDIEEARRLVYNLGPSFNWSAHGFSETDLKNFCWELGKEGFVLQLISLAGLHSNVTATAELAARYKEDGMLAYVQLVQRKEKEIGCDVLTHQKWSGTYVDKIL
ncbi:mitochondrial 2-methylisocitrate lyase [Marasmius sp. AFHP31]|nr:mitochondrial 2-methylisocitrate lyase [Marasmius sp. AFHP31]